MTDYVLTVAAPIASGTAAVTSAIPQLTHAAVPLAATAVRSVRWTRTTSLERCRTLGGRPHRLPNWREGVEAHCGARNAHTVAEARREPVVDEDPKRLAHARDVGQLRSQIVLADETRVSVQQGSEDDALRGAVIGQVPVRYTNTCSLANRGMVSRRGRQLFRYRPGLARPRAGLSR
jgi:hypothetical protein